MVQHSSWPEDAHDRAAMGTNVNNMESIKKEKTMIHKYKDNKHCNMRVYADREHNKYKGRSLSALRKDITPTFIEGIQPQN